MSPSARADDTRAKARAHQTLLTGIEQYKKGDYEGARLSFQESFAVYKTGDALRRLAIAELRTHRPLEAFQHFRMYASDRNADPDFVANDLPNYLAECAALLGHLRVAVPPGAVVLVDGRRVPDPVDGMIVDIAPGDHTVSLRGHEDESQHVLAPAGKVVDVAFDHGDQAPASSPTSVPWPSSPPPSPAPQQPPVSPTVTTSKTLWPPPPISIVFAGVAGTGLAVGAVFAVMKHGNANDREAFRAQHPGAFCGSTQSDACTEWQHMLDSEARNKTIGNIAFGVGIGAAVAAVGTWVLFPRVVSSGSGRAQVTPIIQPGHAGVRVGGTF